MCVCVFFLTFFKKKNIFSSFFLVHFHGPSWFCEVMLWKHSNYIPKKNNLKMNKQKMKKVFNFFLPLNVLLGWSIISVLCVSVSFCYEYAERNWLLSYKNLFHERCKYSKKHFSFKNLKKNFQHTIINETFLFMVIMIWKNEYFNIIFVDFIGLQKTCGLIRYFPKSYFRQNNVLKIRKFDCLLGGVDLSTNSFFFRRV